MATLSKPRIVLIEQKAREDLLTARDVSGRLMIPVPLERIAKKYGLRIVSFKFADPTILGFLKRSEGIIAVSAEDSSSRRQAFTIAHELGHAALHDKDELFRLENLTAQSLPQEETEANWYASCILMPEEEVRMYWRERSPDIRNMADIFGVSIATMTIRLKNLGLIY